MRQREHAEQVALFRWAEVQAAAMPELRELFAIPNGGRRDPVTGARLKAEGVKRGIPDVCLPVARRGYHGAFIEIKAPGGTTRPEQHDRIGRLRLDGYLAEVCVGWEAAAERLRWYLGSEQDG